MNESTKRKNLIAKMVRLIEQDGEARSIFIDRGMNAGGFISFAGEKDNEDETWLLTLTSEDIDAMLYYKDADVTDEENFNEYVDTVYNNLWRYR